MKALSLLFCVYTKGWLRFLSSKCCKNTFTIFLQASLFSFTVAKTLNKEPQSGLLTPSVYATLGNKFASKAPSYCSYCYSAECCNINIHRVLCAMLYCNLCSLILSSFLYLNCFLDHIPECIV